MRPFVECLQRDCFAAGAKAERVERGHREWWKCRRCGLVYVHPDRDLIRWQSREALGVQ